MSIAHACEHLESLLTTPGEWESIWRSSGEPMEIIHVGTPEVTVMSIYSVVPLSLRRFGSWRHDLYEAIDEASRICRSAEIVLLDDNAPLRIRRNHHKWKPRRGDLPQRIFKQVCKHNAFLHSLPVCIFLIH